MPMPKDEVQAEMKNAWDNYLASLDRSLSIIENDVSQASQMTGICTDEWCEATEHVIDDLSNSLFSISEPRWANKEDTAKIKALKHRVYELYANYRQAYQNTEK